MIQKKGQNWSLEATIVLGIFIVIFILSFVYLSFLPHSDSQELKKDSQKIITVLEKDLDLIDEYEINEESFNEIEEYSSGDLAERVGVNGDVCIVIKDMDGKTITLENGKKGIGIDEEYICGN